MSSDDRLVAEVILDATAAFWKGEQVGSPLSILNGLPLVKLTMGADGLPEADPAHLINGAVLACIALSQAQIPVGDTQSSHLAAAREYLAGLVPYDE